MDRPQNTQGDYHPHPTPVLYCYLLHHYFDFTTIPALKLTPLPWTVHTIHKDDLALPEEPSHSLPY